jgi:hypothetical protein
VADDSKMMFDGPIVTCTDCGQALPGHLTICPSLPQIPAAGQITPELVSEVEDAEHKLGEAV